MKNIIRNICTLIVLMVVLMTICIPSYASTVEVNKEKIKEALEDFFGEVSKDGSFKGITDNVIELGLDEETVKISYEIKDNKVIFKNTVVIKDGMDYDTYSKKIASGQMLYAGYLAVTQIADVEIEKAIQYIFFSMFEGALESLDSLGKLDFNLTTYDGYLVIENNTTVTPVGDKNQLTTNGISFEVPKETKLIRKKEFGKYAVEFAKNSFKGRIAYDDSKTFNTYCFEYKANPTEKDCQIDYIMTVNLDGDFNKINEIDLGNSVKCSSSSGEHKFSEEIIKQATCKEEGEKKYICDVCEHSYIEVVPAEGHTYVSEITQEASCAQNGIKRFTCKKCKDTYTEEIPALAHKYEERMRTERSCEKDAIIGYRCKNCGGLHTEIIAKAKGHNYEVVTKDATCTTNGSKTYKCKECGDTYTKPTEAAKGHNYKEETMEDGSKKYTCLNCNDTYTQKSTTIDKNNNINDTQSSNRIVDNIPYIIIGVGIVIAILIGVVIVLSIKRNY